MLLEVKVLDNVLIVKRGGSFDFFFEKLECSSVELGVVQAEDLESEFLAIISGSELYLGAFSLSKGPSEAVVIES